MVDQTVIEALVESTVEDNPIWSGSAVPAQLTINFVLVKT